MNEVSYIVDTTLQLQECFGIRILMSNLRPPLMKIISTPLSLFSLLFHILIPSLINFKTACYCHYWTIDGYQCNQLLQDVHWNRCGVKVIAAALYVPVVRWQGKKAREPGKKQKENPVGCTGEGKNWRGNRSITGSFKRRKPPVFEFGAEVTLVRLACMYLSCQIVKQTCLMKGIWGNSNDLGGKTFYLWIHFTLLNVYFHSRFLDRLRGA